MSYDYDTDSGEAEAIDPTAPALFQVKAQYENEPDDDDELAFNEGDIIDVLDADDDDWWTGRTQSGSVGTFPSNYVTRLDGEDEEDGAFLQISL